MSYAIIRNANYKRENLPGLYKHNERKNTNYSNKDINKNNSINNYSIKQCNTTYSKAIKQLIAENDLKCRITSYTNLVCEFIITSDKEFFDSIGENETKRYFETAYKFVCEYKELGEQYILSAKVHMDEESPHMHLVFIPVVHTTDKKGNNIDKIACSEFWKAKDSYRQLQNAFHSYITANGFDLERGNPSERVHLSVEDYKKITNFENTKTVLKDIKLELPETPDVKSFGKLVRNRDEKIQELVVEPRDKMIKEQQEQISLLYLTLQNQVNTVERASKYEKERKSIMCENRELKEKCENMEKDYSVKLKEEIRKVENKYEDEIYQLEKENSFLRKVINTFQKTVDKFIHWVCNKFSVSSEEEFIRDFEFENDIYLDPEKQIEYEEEKEWNLEL